MTFTPRPGDSYSGAAEFRWPLDLPGQTALFDRLLEELNTAVVSDVLDELGYRNQVMRADIHPVYAGATLIGRAHTMASEDVFGTTDTLYDVEIAAVDSIQPNDVVVASTNQSTRTCLWGELLSTVAVTNGGRGALIDGYSRDTSRIERLGFPVFSTGTKPVDSAGRGVVVSYGDPILFGGVQVQPGDIVLADVDGVVVIPQPVEAEAITMARLKVAREDAMREWLLQGRSLREAFDHFGTH